MVAEERTREIPFTVMVPQTQTRKVQLTETHQEERTREVAYTVMVPKEVERQYTQIVNKPVTEEQLVSYTEMVPQTITRQIRVPETIMVARQIQIDASGPILR